MEGLARIIWVKIPTLVTRLSRPLGGIMADGQYFTGNAVLAVIVPAAGLFAGLLSGVIHPDALFTASLPLTGLMLLFACFGSGIGVYAWIGYVIGDLTHLAPGAATVLGSQGGHFVLASVGPLGHLYSYLVLAMLIIVLPIGARSLREATGALIPGGENPVIQAVLAGALTAGMVFLWRFAMPIMVRPVFTLEGNVPTVESVSTIQTSLGLVLVFEAALLGVLRGYLDTTARGTDGFDGAKLAFSAASQRTKSLSERVPAIIRVLGRAIFFVLLLLGLMNSIVETAVAFIGVAAILAITSLVIPRLTGLTDLLKRIPIVVRLIGGLVIGLALSYAVITPFYAGTSSLFPVLIGALLAITVMAIMVPEGAILIGPGTAAERRP